MSIAWGSLVLLILLLPGFLFFVGTLFPEQFTRDAEQRSPLGHLAGSLAISFFVHGGLYALSQLLCGGRLGCVSVGALLVALNATPQSPDSITNTEAMFQAFGVQIFLYVMGTCAIGASLGAAYGKLVSSKRFNKFTKHAWVYDLAADGLTYAHVMTNVRQGNLVLMYKGFLRAAGLRLDGKFSYLVLRDVTRYYMRLDDAGPVTSEPAHQRPIGQSTGTATDQILVDHQRVPSSALFVIEGEDLQNVVFERLAVRSERVSSKEFSAIVTEESRKLRAEAATIAHDPGRKVGD
ncbi:MAG: hypothetical protein ABI877_20555 [Gemmatimonadaceae bacterium]